MIPPAPQPAGKAEAMTETHSIKIPVVAIAETSEACPHFEWMQPNGKPHEKYKQDLLRQYQDAWCAEGITDPYWIKLLSGQMAQENGSMTVDRTGDSGCSLGLFQRNACVHDNMSAKAFLKANPSWNDPKVQMKYMTDRIKGYLAEFDNDIELAIVAHNAPGRVRAGYRDSKRGYLQKEVMSKVKQMVQVD